MNKSLILLLSLVFSIVFFAGCSKDEANSEAEIESFVNQSVQNLEAQTRTGRGGCFELVFPVSIEFSTGEVVEVDSYEALKNAIRDWRKENNIPKGKPVVKPQFVYPIELITADGETVTVNSLLELLQLKKDCKDNGNGQGRACFRLNYPLSISYPEGTVVSYANGRAMVMALRTWKKENPTAVLRPVLVFPITITMEDGSVVTVNSREELAIIKRSCK